LGLRAFGTNWQGIGDVREQLEEGVITLNPTVIGPPELRDDRIPAGTLPAPRIFATDLSGSSLPARGLFYSVLVHGLCAIVSLYVPWSYWFPPDVHLVTAQSLIHEHEVLYLPDLQPMASDSSPAPSSHEAKEEESPASSPSPKAIQGVVYRGPQLIVSNPPHPDNVIQTIRQPDLPVRPKLPAPLQMPPIVSIAAAKPMLAPPIPRPVPEVPPQTQPVQVAAVAPIRLPAEQPRVEAPKLPLPAASSDALLRTVANPAAAPMPALAKRNPGATNGDQAHNILVISAIPMPVGKPPVLPMGELAGAFIVSPQPLPARPAPTATAPASGGSEARGAHGLGNASSAPSGSGLSSNPGTGSKSAGSTGKGNAVRAGLGGGSGTHPDNLGGKGAGSAFGTGTGTHASGNGSGSGGTGSGSGSSPFSSIMIQGGSGGGRSARIPVAGASGPQGSYGITIVANGASGGGFKDFGVFRDEASYTVYLDMTDTGANGSSWTLQYALDSANRSSYSHGVLVPPFAISKSLPRISFQAATRDRGAIIVVFGVINPQGRFEDLRIMQSPDSDLNPLLLDALGRWTFRPAEIDGARVRVKVLLGVPVNSVPLRE
jgi:hypothetical protein